MEDLKCRSIKLGSGRRGGGLSGFGQSQTSVQKNKKSQKNGTKIHIN